MEHEHYYIHNEQVTPREITLPMDSPLGDSYTRNVLDYKGEQHNIICNGNGDCWILIDGKKRYLEQ